MRLAFYLPRPCWGSGSGRVQTPRRSEARGGRPASWDQDGDRTHTTTRPPTTLGLYNKSTGQCYYSHYKDKTSQAKKAPSGMWHPRAAGLETPMLYDLCQCLPSRLLLPWKANWAGC